jgi:hypothetical protein
MAKIMKILQAAKDGDANSSSHEKTSQEEILPDLPNLKKHFARRKK